MESQPSYGPRSRYFLLTLALSMALFVVGLGGVSFYHKVQSFQPVGIELEAQGPRVFVVATGAANPDLRPNDQILLVNGAQITGIKDLVRRLAEHPQSEVTVARPQELAQVSYVRPPLDFDVPYLILAAIGMGYLLIGLYTLVRELNSQVLLFYFWCVTSAVAYVFTGQPSYEVAIHFDSDQVAKLIYLVEEVARLLLPPLTLHFFLVFPTRISSRAWLRPALPFLYLPSAVLLTLHLDLFFFNGRWLAGDPSQAIPRVERPEPFMLVAFSFLSVAVLLYQQLRPIPWQERRQALWIAVGMAGGYLPFLLLYLIPYYLGLQGPELVSVLAVLPLALVPLSFAYAILRYRLWDVAIIVRDVTTYALTLLVGGGGFALLHLMIRRGIPEEFSLAQTLLSFVAGFLVLGLLVPTKQGISATLERVQYRTSLGKRRALLEFGRQLLRERDLDSLCFGLLNRLEEAMDLERSNLYLVEAQSMAPVWIEEGLPAELETDALGEDLWQQDFVTLSGVGVPGLELSAVQTLFLLGYRYAFPLTVRGNSVGVVVTGEKHGQVPFSSDDVMLIRQLLNQAALAIDNAQLLEQLQRQLNEVLELKQFNEGIIESSPAGIAVLDENECIVSANLAFAALAGVERSATRRRKLSDLLPLDSLPAPDAGLIEVSFPDSRGRDRHLQLSTATFQHTVSERLRVLVVNDVSERVAMEKALKEKERLAALGVMAAGVAHEVNTPLTGVSSYAQMLLADTQESDPRYELLKKIERQTFRAARIVNNLLDLARERDGDASPVHLANLMGESVDLLAERLAEHAIELRWAPPRDPILVAGNEGELHQLFNNLLANAIDAMARGGGVLTLSLDGDGNRAAAKVEDTGPGIPPSHLEQIFQPFFSTKLGSGGTGLGLSISHEIVRRHGGELRVRNKPGKGCCFEVLLPLFH